MHILFTTLHVFLITGQAKHSGSNRNAKHSYSGQGLQHGWSARRLARLQRAAGEQICGPGRRADSQHGHHQRLLRARCHPIPCFPMTHQFQGQWTAQISMIIMTKMV